jgi:hypothetical protein
MAALTRTFNFAMYGDIHGKYNWPLSRILRRHHHSSTRIGAAGGVPNIKLLMSILKHVQGDIEQFDEKVIILPLI